MRRRFAISPVSLRIKLILSYLAVALGAVLILSFAVALEVRNLVYNAQVSSLRQQVASRAEQIQRLYHLTGTSWNNFPRQSFSTNDPIILIASDSTGKEIICIRPAFIVQGICQDPTLTTAMKQAQSGQEIDGTIQITVNNSTQNMTADSSFSSLYVSIPINDNGQIIGTLLISEPLNADGTNQVILQINQGLLLAGLIVAALVILFSFFFARRLTRPLAALTEAAEQVKQGKYTQRVKPTGSQDELGQLALAFNAMADTIEADINELRRQEQARRDLIANIAHDLATPLTAIQGFSEALGDDIITEQQARQETAQRIGREVQRLRRLVGDMQQMTTLESGRAHLDLAPLDMQSLVEETLTVIEPECEQTNITLHNEIAPTMPLVRADSDRIIQVLLNLLDNARRHTPANGSIHIRASVKEQFLIIRVCDTGSGIDPNDLSHIFERFYRADRSRTGKTGGSGLGLSIVKAIIVAHGGKIWAESNPGQGTTISFSLPLAQ